MIYLIFTGKTSVPVTHAVAWDRRDHLSHRLDKKVRPNRTKTGTATKQYHSYKWIICLLILIAYYNQINSLPCCNKGLSATIAKVR